MILLKTIYKLALSRFLFYKAKTGYKNVTGISNYFLSTNSKFAMVKDANLNLK